MTATMTDRWTVVCRIADLVPDRGVCALVAGRPVAVFVLSGSGEVVAVDNVDPCSGASVLSRGLVGSIDVEGDRVAYVASPLRKQRFDLRSGRCLDDDDVSVDVFEVRVDCGSVVVRRSPAGADGGSSWGNERETPS